VFVQNRLKEIRTNTDKTVWYHVPGVENVADIPSTGCFPSMLESEQTKKRWLEGPEWLQGKEETWPIRQNVKEKWDDPELKNVKTKQVTNLIASKESCSSIETCIVPERLHINQVG